MNKLDIFYKRLQKLNISLEFIGNYPWIYIDKINDKKVTEKYLANHGFTIAFYSKNSDDNINFTDISTIFKLIRKYKTSLI